MWYLTRNDSKYGRSSLVVDDDGELMHRIARIAQCDGISPEFGSYDYSGSSTTRSLGGTTYTTDDYYSSWP
jgi:hypothetical protein